MGAMAPAAAEEGTRLAAGRLAAGRQRRREPGGGSAVPPREATATVA